MSTPYEKNTSLKHLRWCVVSAVRCWFTNLLHKCFLRILPVEYFYYFLSAWYLVATYFCKDLFLWERLWRILCRYTFVSKRFPQKNCGFKFANLNLTRTSKECIYGVLWASFNKTLLKLYLNLRKLFFLIFYVDLFLQVFRQSTICGDSFL